MSLFGWCLTGSSEYILWTAYSYLLISLRFLLCFNFMCDQVHFCKHQYSGFILRFIITVYILSAVSNRHLTRFLFSYCHGKNCWNQKVGCLWCILLLALSSRHLHDRNAKKWRPIIFFDLLGESDRTMTRVECIKQAVLTNTTAF